MSLRAAYLNLGSFFGVAKKETPFPNSQIKPSQPKEWQKNQAISI